MFNNFQTSKYYLIANLLFSSFVPYYIKDQIAISYEEIGNIMGSYMCRSLIEKNTISDDEIMEEFADNLISQYGEQKALMIMEEVKEAFDDNNPDLNQNSIDLMKGVFQHIIKNDDCFEIFIKEEVFK